MENDKPIRTDQRLQLWWAVYQSSPAYETDTALIHRGHHREIDAALRGAFIAGWDAGRRRKPLLPHWLRHPIRAWTMRGIIKAEVSPIPERAYLRPFPGIDISMKVKR